MGKSRELDLSRANGRGGDVEIRNFLWGGYRSILLLCFWNSEIAEELPCRLLGTARVACYAICLHLYHGLPFLPGQAPRANASGGRHRQRGDGGFRGVEQRADRILSIRVRGSLLMHRMPSHCQTMCMSVHIPRMSH